MFKKREGTAGISGHLFETKLLCLLYFRAIRDDRIKEFQLASNVDNMGAFDDICFQAEVEDFNRPVMIFIQAKHKENKNQTLKIDLATYFISYLKVKQQFHQYNNDAVEIPGAGQRFLKKNNETNERKKDNKELFSKGTFDETECFFVLYTTARDEFSSGSRAERSFFSILNDLIGTGGTAKQPYKLDEDVEFLCKVAMKEQMISLAERIAKFINDDSNFQVMLTDELIQRYHVILAQKAVEVSEIKPDGHRIASFRLNFFDVDDEYLTIFKDTLFKQILQKRKIKPSDVKKILSDYLTKPTDASILSKLVGTVVAYNNGQLMFDSKFTNDFGLNIKTIDVPRSTFNKAVELAAKDILLSPEFKLRVPAAFGNKDLTLSGSDEKKKKRIKHLSSKIIDLLDNCTSSGIVTIDETLEDGLLQLNGGIAGAIGNMLVLDDDTKLMKITNDVDSLGSLAKCLYERLNSDIELINKKRSNNKILSLSKYKFFSKVNKFPKLLLECDENEEEAKDFLSKLVIYSNQADEEGLENILKSEIEENLLNQPNYLQVHIDAIYSKYHDEMLKWWKLPKHAPILTRKNDFFERAKQSIIIDPLLNVIRKVIDTDTYNEIKCLHVDRRLRKSGDDKGIVVNTFNNIQDDVVLVTAEPGMGKSTLLTRLSIKTKELKPEVWIVRINLLEFSREFCKWKEEKTVIDILETIKFLCQVIIRDKFGKETKVEIALEERDNVVCLTHCTDPLIELELNLFLHFYHERDMIFLFDGFDEICSHYMDVVMECLRCLRDHHKQRMWITSRSYNDINTVLQEEFGLSYEILHFTHKEMIKYLAIFWKNSLNLKKLNPTQLENVKKFLDYMAIIWKKRVTFSKPLNAVFKIAACYLDYGIAEGQQFFEKYSIEELNCDVNPFFLQLTALYVVDSIENKHSEEWYFEVDAFKVYVRFLEIKIKRLFQEKYEMNIYNPDIIWVLNKEITDSILKHKLLGAYAIFYKLNPTLFSRKDLEDIKEMIEVLEKGEDKMGLIDSVANGIPIFSHRSFTEYFAVEFVCDHLKMDSNSEKLEYFYMMFMGGFVNVNVRRIFNHKLKIDKTLMSILEQNEDVIFNWIQSHFEVNSPQVGALLSSMIEDLNNLRSFFEKIIKIKANLPNKTSAQQAALNILKFTLDLGKNIAQTYDVRDSVSP